MTSVMAVRVEEFLAGDRTDSILMLGERPKWQCVNYAVELYRRGIEPGLPVFIVNLTREGFGHSFNTFFVGDDVSRWEDWYFVEPQNDRKYSLATLPKMSVITICDPVEIDSSGGWFSYEPVVEFRYGYDSITAVTVYRGDTRTGMDSRVDPEGGGVVIYPNPFNSELRIVSPGRPEVDVYSITGRHVVRVVDGVWIPEGVASGVYVVVIWGPRRFEGW